MQSKPLRVLLVDDNEDEYLIVRDLLADNSRTNFEIDWIQTYDECLQVLAEHRHDVCLMDFNLNPGSGLDLIRHAVSEGCRFPFILFTGQRDEASDEAAMQAGAADFLIKGEITSDLLERSIRYSVRHAGDVQSVRNNEARFRALVEKSAEGILLLNAQGNVSFATQSSKRLLGYEPAELHGRYLSAMSHPDDSGQLHAFLQNLLQDFGAFGVIESRLLQEDGSWRWYELSITNLLQEPSVGAIVSNYRDISVRKDADQAERELQWFLQSTLDALTSHIAVLDESGNIIAVNDAWQEYARENNGVDGSTGVGLNYLQICEAAVGRWSSEARAVAAGIRAVLNNEQEIFLLEYPCHNASGEQWYVVRVTRFNESMPGRVVVAHENISERKQAELERDRFFTVSFDLLSVVGRNGLLRHYNPAFEETMGYAAAELMSRPLWEFAHPEDRERVQLTFTGVGATEPVINFESRFCCRDGSFKWLAWNIVRHGELLYAAARDVSQLIEIKAKQDMSHSLLLATLEATADGILVTLGEEGAPVNFNQKFLEMWRIPDEVAQERHTDSFRKYQQSQVEEPQQFLQRTREMHQNQEAKSVDVLRFKDGRIVKRYSQPQRFEGGIVGRVSSFRDVTEAFRANELQAELTERIQQQRQQLNEILENVPGVVWEMWLEPDEKENRIDFVSSFVKQLLGYSPDEWIARPNFWQDVLHPEDLDAALQSQQEIFATGEGQIQLYRMRKASGQYTWVETVCAAIVDEAQNVVGLRGVTTDITERRRVQAELLTANAALQRVNEELESRVVERTLELEQSNREYLSAKEEADISREEAEKANRAKSEFISRMSHELRTPLNAILGFGQILEMRHPVGREAEAVEQILKGGRHLLQLINEILDVARIEAGRLTLSPEPINIQASVREVLDIVHPLALPQQIELVNQVQLLPDNQTYCAVADRQRLHQVLLNLLSNAIKYNRENGRVTVSCWQLPELQEEKFPDAQYLRIEIADTGLGIRVEDQPRLFQPFERLGAEQLQIEGTGIGLALAKRLVEAMHGRIGVQSEAGVGSRFWVDLPKAIHPVGTLLQSEESYPHFRQFQAAVAAGRKLKFLYIEDNASNLRVIEHLLAELKNVQLISAIQGRIGLDLAREHRPDLILLDLHLPDIEGDEVLRQLQMLPETMKTPVVMLSADCTPHQIQRLLAAGARAYLTKPLEIQSFVATIQQVLEEVALAQDLKLN